MKRDEYTEVICRGFCRFYKEGREGLTCGTYNFLARNLTPNEIRSRVQRARPRVDFSYDREIEELICEQCDFVEDGCDFRAGQGEQPCGGYALVEWLLRKRV